jgi:hypothetical protein
LVASYGPEHDLKRLKLYLNFRRVNFKEMIDMKNETLFPQNRTEEDIRNQYMHFAAEFAMCQLLSKDTSHAGNWMYDLEKNYGEISFTIDDVRRAISEAEERYEYYSEMIRQKEERERKAAPKTYEQILNEIDDPCPSLEYELQSNERNAIDNLSVLLTKMKKEMK